MRLIAWAVYTNWQLRHPPRDLNKCVDTFSRRNTTEKESVVVWLLVKRPSLRVQRRGNHPLVIIAVLLSCLAVMPMHPCTAFVYAEGQARPRRVAHTQFNVMAFRKEIVYFHVRARDVAHDVAGPGTRPNFV